MLISKHWLRDFVFLPDTLDPQELERALTLHTVEVEGWIRQDELLDQVVVGVVNKMEKHPDADKLNICQVFDGTQEIQIVCGGSNVVEGMKVALGKIGAKVKWHGEGEPVQLKKTKIRGEVSLGMICAAEEIGLGDLYPSTDDHGILDLSHIQDEAGTPISKALSADNVIIDIDNKSMSHRQDLWGHYGIAREIAAIYKKKFNVLTFNDVKEGEGDVVIVENKSEACKRYQSVIISDVTVGPSPYWLQRRLQDIGLTSINNVVDLTNYVMYELGQPMHAFDLDKLQKSDNGQYITIRPASSEESIVTLDGKLRMLDEKTIVIADAQKPVAIAGIMGGQNSEVDQDTTSILLECANFDATTIRKMSQLIGLRTDASTRFEKTLDPNMTGDALRRFVQLLLEMVPAAQVQNKVSDTGVVIINQGPIEVSTSFISQKIGEEIDKKTMLDMLDRLGFEVKEKKETLFITVPTWRATKDISIKEDIVEEVARMYGYENIKTTLPIAPIVPVEKHVIERLNSDIRSMLSAQDFVEVMNYAFVSPDHIDQMETANEPRLELDNPVAKDRPFLRRYLSTNLVQLVEKNTHRYNEVACFELGKVFHPEEVGERAEVNSDELLSKQHTMLGIVYANKQDETPFYQVSKSVRMLLKKSGYDATIAAATAPTFGHPGRSAEVIINNISVGFITELHPKIQQKVGINFRVAIAELDVEVISSLKKQEKEFTKIPQFPGIERDIAFEVKNDIEDIVIKKVIKSVHTLIHDVSLIDIYMGEHVSKGSKSMTYRVTYLDKDTTLTSKEVDKIHAEVIGTLQDKFEAKER